MNEVNITGYSSHIFSATAPIAEQWPMFTNRGRHCPACCHVTEALRLAETASLFKTAGARCGVTLHFYHSSVRVSVTTAKKSFHVRLHEFKRDLCEDRFMNKQMFCVQTLKLQFRECTTPLQMKAGDR